ncbi:MAG TPA: hypothetical protein VLJ88_04355 [Propionibacteriaceae bacterium]|nr:hypothetical protein [Propionibacteriaceae bacterium]
MARPDPEALDASRRGYQRRAAVGAVVLVLLIASAVLPHVAVLEATAVPGRSLVPASNFFLNAQAGAEGFAGGTSVGAVALALNTTYMGLALQQIGLLLAVASAWGLIMEDVGRWIRRFAFAAGVALVLGASTTMWGYMQLVNAGIPSLAGIAWLPTLAAGLILVFSARAARHRVVSTWFWDRPGLVQP